LGKKDFFSFQKSLGAEKDQQIGKRPFHCGFFSAVLDLLLSLSPENAMKASIDSGTLIAAATLPFLYGLSGCCIAQHEFYKILALMAVLFAAYAWIISRKQSDQSLLFWLAFALICRIVLLFSLPQWSDDYFRFIWDGRLVISGISPFEALPSAYAAQGFPIANLDNSLYEKLNSPNYHSIYPPVAQVIFTIACALFPTDVDASAIAMKAILLALETGSLYLIWQLLKKWGLPAQNILIYALNPLVIIEISGNLHFEGVMIFFALLSFWRLSQQKTGRAGAALALSVAAKLVSALAVPFIIKQLVEKQFRPFLGIFSIILALCFAPWAGILFFQHFGQSLDLYFRQFEFNAGLYNLVQWITRGNPIKIAGPLLAIAALTIIAFQLYVFRPSHIRKLPQALLFAVCSYLFCATTVHPWYLCLPVAMSVFTRHRFALWWSGLAVLSYYTYSTPNGKENLTLLAIEYAIVWFILFKELYRFSKANLSESSSAESV